MATIAWVIRVCACVRYWPYRRIGVACASCLLLLVTFRWPETFRKFPKITRRNLKITGNYSMFSKDTFTWREFEANVAEKGLTKNRSPSCENGFARIHRRWKVLVILLILGYIRYKMPTKSISRFSNEISVEKDISIQLVFSGVFIQKRKHYITSAALNCFE